MAELIVDALSKRYGNVVAIEDVTFTVKEGEFVTLLGPSGCGKSTTLGAIAGLQSPSSGTIKVGPRVYFDDANRIEVPAEARDLGLVFQSYALWPHMTVRRNVEFPLRLRKVAKADIKNRVDRVLALVEMTQMAERYPHELSGGQQQRAALARTLVYEPSILLLDEPLSNLDAKLRERARAWLSEIRDKIGLTTVYVTHDHGEALSLSDRIVVMNGGRIIQIGTPQEIYETPAEPFVADFIGASNFLHGHVKTARNDRHEAVVVLPSGHEVGSKFTREIKAGVPVAVAVRPERVRIVSSADGERDPSGSLLPAKLRSRSYFGARWHYELEVSGDTLKVNSEVEHTGDEFDVWIPTYGCTVFETEEAKPGERFRFNFN